MSHVVQRIARFRPRPWMQRGAVLVIGLLLLLVLSVLGLSAMVMATLELQMSANFKHQEQAFEAAEYGIEQAIRAPDLSTVYTLASPKLVPASGADPLVPGSDTDTYRYRLYYDTAAGSGSVPDAASVGPGVAALHFLVESTGRSSRSAEDTHIQSFYVLLPASCVAGGPGCGSLASYAPVRSSWRQANAD
jgi:type IV pilus assembly protein PilX